MKDNTTTGHRLAIATGFLATTGGLAILLSDALVSGEWKLEHGLIPILMGVQVLTGHLFTTACAQWRVVPAIGFFIVAAVSTWGVLYTSVGKQSAIQADASIAAKDVEERRAPIERMIADAQFMLADCPAGTPKAHIGERCGLRAAMASECGSGKGKRCDGKSYSVSTYEAAITGYSDQLAKIGAPKATGTRAATMAKVIAKVHGGDEASIRETLVLIEPFTYATIFELAALVSFGFAFGHRRTKAVDPKWTAQTSFPANDGLGGLTALLDGTPPNNRPTNVVEYKRKGEDDVKAFSMQFFKDNGRVARGIEAEKAFAPEIKAKILSRSTVLRLNDEFNASLMASA